MMGLPEAMVQRAMSMGGGDAPEPSSAVDEEQAAMRADVLDTIAESVARSGTDLSTNLKLGFMLKRAKAMGVEDSALEAILGGPIPVAAPKAAAPARAPAASGGDASPEALLSAIMEAVQQGGADPEENMRLGFALRKAQMMGLPEAMVQRAMGMGGGDAPEPSSAVDEEQVKGHSPPTRPLPASGSPSQSIGETQKQAPTVQAPASVGDSGPTPSAATAPDASSTAAENHSAAGEHTNPLEHAKPL